MSSRFALHANVPSSSLPGEWHVSLPSGKVMRIAWVFSGCEVLVEGAQFKEMTFLDDSAHHWWTFASRNRGGVQDMTLEEFKTLFLGQYFGHAQRIRIQSDFLNMKKGDDEGVIKFEQKDLSYEDEPVQILDRKEQVLRSKSIQLVKVLWRSHQGEEAT
ncbi:hypothetical protein ACLB2K_074021 [Fragaria x ananassa]